MDYSFSDVGGFMNGTDPGSSSKQKKEQVRRVQSIVPVVARQLLECPTEEFSLFDLPVQIVSLVGILHNFEVQSTKATCVVEDFSGSIKAVLWLESEKETQTEIPAVKEGFYVQVFGSIRNQDGEKIIMILQMFPVHDCNVITSHLLQFIHARLEAEALASEEIKVDKPSASSMGDMDESGMRASFTAGLTPIQREIFKILQPGDDCVGVSKETIMKRFKKSQENEVDEALNFFLAEGYVYSTIDSDHFKLTDGLN